MKNFLLMLSSVTFTICSQSHAWDYDKNDNRSNGKGDWAGAAYDLNAERSATDQAFNNRSNWTTEEKQNYYRESAARSFSRTSSGDGRGDTGNGGYYNDVRLSVETVRQNLYPPLREIPTPEPPDSPEYSYSIPTFPDESARNVWMLSPGNFPPYPEAAPTDSTFYYGDLIEDKELLDYSLKVDALRKNEQIPTLTTKEKLWGYIQETQPAKDFIYDMGTVAELGLVDNYDVFKNTGTIIDTVTSILEKTEDERVAVKQAYGLTFNGLANQAPFGGSIWGVDPTKDRTVAGRKDVPREYRFSVEVYSKENPTLPEIYHEGIHGAMLHARGEVLKDIVTAREFRLEMGTVVSDAMRIGAQQASLALDVIDNHIPDSIVEALETVEYKNKNGLTKTNYLLEDQELTANTLAGYAINDLVTRGIIQGLTPEQEVDFQEDADRIVSILDTATSGRNLGGWGWNRSTLSDKQIRDFLDEVVNSPELQNAFTVIDNYLR